MSKSNHYRAAISIIIVLLIISSLAVLNVKAQPTPTSGNWSQVATFTGENSVNTDSFTCDHVEWRIRWEADIMDLLFYFTDYFLQITTFPEGSINYYIDFINGSFSSISDSGDRVSGTSYIHDHAGSFYLRIITSTNTEKYRVIVEQNTDSPIPSPTPMPTPWIYEYRGFYIEQVGSNYIVSENYLETYISPLFSTIEEAKEWIDYGPTATPQPNDGLTPQFAFPTPLEAQAIVGASIIIVVLGTAIVFFLYLLKKN